MKNEKMKNVLSLNKETVAKLSTEEIKKINGGVDWKSFSFWIKIEN